MDRKKFVLDKYRKLRIDTREIFDDTLIKRLNMLSEYYLDIFNQFHDYYFELATEEYGSSKSDTIHSYRVKRSCILPFIEFFSTKNIELNKLSNRDINDFFLQKNFGSKATLSNYISHLSSFLDFFEIQFERKTLVELGEYINKSPRIHTALTSKEIENIRHYCKSNELMYYLFIFEAMYSLNIPKENLGLYRYENYKSEEKKFILSNGRELPVDNYIHNIIESLKNHKQFNFSKQHNDYISDMEMIFIDNGLINNYFRYKDIQYTHKKQTYNTCPECGTQFRNIADNWVIKQYENSDTKWIVCKAKCGKADEN